MFFAKLAVLKWRHIHSKSPVFCLTVLFPIGRKISRFWYLKTRGMKSAIEKIFCYTYQYIGEIQSSK